MNYGYMIIYQNNKDNLIYRAVKNKPMYKVGDTTSMGWKVKSILHLYNGKVYSHNEFTSKLKRRTKLNDLNVISNVGKLLQYLILVLVILQLCVNLLYS